MSGLSDAAVSRLKALGRWPELTSGRYSIVEEIGRGGMGTIYLAIDEELGREVAIKVSHAHGSATLERRLQIEARVLARLEHPGIVPIHDAGRLADDRLFYVMKRVRGRTLSEHLHDVLDPTERLEVFVRVCEPVAFAHAQGVVHRDLKPDNVMVGSFGEVMVMDWGVAKSLIAHPSWDGSRSRESEPHVIIVKPSREAPEVDETESPHRTHEGTVIGTRGFMAPEQARGAVESIDQRADVYSLGAMLFWMLTDEVPSQDRDPLVAAQRRGVVRPLAAICARALAADPASRYQTVTALADDVACYRAGRTVAAYPETAAERVARFGRTYRTAILLVLAYIVMRVVVAIVGG